MSDRERRATLEATHARLRELGEELQLEHAPEFEGQLASLTAKVEVARARLTETTTHAQATREQLQALTQVVDGLIVRLERREHEQLDPIFAALALILGVAGGWWALPPLNSPPIIFAGYGLLAGAVLGLLAGPRLLDGLGVPTPKGDATARLGVALSLGANALCLGAVAIFLERSAELTTLSTDLALVGIATSLSVFALVARARREQTPDERTRSIARRLAALPLGAGVLVGALVMVTGAADYVGRQASLLLGAVGLFSLAALGLTWQQPLARLGRRLRSWWNQ
jgi:hypothetical protein